MLNSLAMCWVSLYAALPRSRDQDPPRRASCTFFGLDLRLAYEPPLRHIRAGAVSAAGLRAAEYPSEDCRAG